jgi:hypothetical protein
VLFFARIPPKFDTIDDEVTGLVAFGEKQKCFASAVSRMPPGTSFSFGIISWSSALTGVVQRDLPPRE